MEDSPGDSAELSLCRAGQGEQALKNEHSHDDPTVPEF